MTRTQKNVALIAGVAALLVATAGASAFVATKIDDKAPPAKVAVHHTSGNHITWDQSRAQPQPQQVASNCDDGNIVGTALGGVAGGVLGNQVGKGHGNTAATIAGAVGGAYVGNQYIPTRNTLCR